MLEVAGEQRAEGGGQFEPAGGTSVLHPLSSLVSSLEPACKIRDLGRVRYAEAFALQQKLVEQRKRGEISDQLLFVEHPHVVTMGRSGHDENLLAEIGRAHV